MVGTSKILTVSYGTFSCTLEGFDDPFSTMRGIAEYFRDLAADDRYFGAEPPTPDAEMLHRIAEREIQRRVIASVDGNGVTLRQIEDDDEDAPTADAAATAPRKKKKKDKSKARALALGDTASEANEMAGEAAAAAPATVAAAPKAAKSDPLAQPRPAESPESFAAKMLRIRAAVARSAAADAFLEDPQPEALLGFKPISSAFDDSPADEVAAPVETAENLPEDMVADAALAPAEVAPEVEAAPAEVAVERLSDALVEAEAKAEADEADLEIAIATEAAALEAAEAELDSEAIETDEALAARDEAVEPDESFFQAEAEGEAEAEAEAEAEEDMPVDLDLATLISRVSESAGDAPEGDAETAPADEAEFVSEAEVWTAAPAEVAPAPTAPRLVRARVIKMRKSSIEREAEDLAEFDDGLPPMPVLAKDRARDQDDEDGLFTIAAAVARAVNDDAAGDPAEDHSETTAEAFAVDAEDEDWSDAASDLVADDLLADSADSNDDSEFAVDSDDDAEDAPPTLTGSTLPDDEEASLLAELAEVEAESVAQAEPVADFAADADDLDNSDDDEAPGAIVNLDDDLDDDDEEADGARIDSLFAEDRTEVPTPRPTRPAARPQQRTASETPRPGREGKTLLEKTRSGDDDFSVTRILKETNSQLDDTEALRRRSTIAHLKAAVAATRADRDITGDAAEPEEDLSEYRNDLERVVRPRRPGERATGTTRRLAPLMLVSEQRVDLPNGDFGADAVRPRRITAGNLALMEDEQLDDEVAATNGDAIGDSISFADYAEKLAATELPDILEAAAAYAAYVEGRPHFSRPQLMKTAMDAVGNKFSREDGLRSFGTLLRTGKIQKIKRGQFTIAKKSRFRPDSAQA